MIALEARRELRRAAQRLAALRRQNKAIADSTTRARIDVRRYLDEFAMSFDDLSAATLPQPATGAGGLHLNLQVMRAELDALDSRQASSVSLEANFAAAEHLFHSALARFSPEEAFTATDDGDSIRLRQAASMAREEERRRLSLEIHDGPAQVLGNAILAIHTVEQIAKRTPGHVPEALSEVAKLLKDGVAEIRRFMFDLRPAMLNDLGLGPTLARYVADYGTFHARQVELVADATLPRLTIEQELHVFRIVQESLQNFLKHAGPNARATVHVVQEPSFLRITVKDDGIGFDSERISPRDGQGRGLSGMRERASLVGALLSVISTVGQGTSVLLDVPLGEHAHAFGHDSATHDAEASAV